jgi:hypothetical protein
MTEESLKEVIILRERPANEILDDPEVWVIDCGGRLEPSKRNFDHHQLDDSHDPVCSLSYILHHIDPELLVMGRECLNWLIPTEINDSKGPRNLTCFLGLDSFSLQVLPIFSPIEKALLHMFSQEHIVSEEMKNILYSVGKSILDELYKTIKRLEELKKHAEVITIKSMEVLDISNAPQVEGLPPYVGVEAYCKRYCPQVGIIVDKEHNGSKTGLELIRRNNNKHVDMRRLGSRSHVRFVEPSGRFAKTKDQSEEWRNYLHEALI